MTRTLRHSAASARLEKTQIWKEGLVHQMGVLPFTQTLTAWRREGSRAFFSMCTNTPWEGMTKVEQDPLQWSPLQGEEAMGINHNT